MVLIIEDDPDIAEILRYALERENFKSRIAYTGEEALKASLDQANPPTLILLDLLLPGMDGKDICRRLRLEPLTRNTPILVITAKVFETEMDATLKSGANAVIFKPFSIQEVISRVRSFTNSKMIRMGNELLMFSHQNERRPTDASATSTQVSVKCARFFDLRRGR